MTVHRERDARTGEQTMDPIHMRSASGSWKSSGDLYAHDTAKWVHVWPVGVLLPPRSVHVSGVSQTELDFAWVLATQPAGAPTVTAVWVRLVEQGTTWTVLAANATTTALTGLSPATRYTFQVRVVHVGVDGTFMSPVVSYSATTLKTVTPPVPITATTWPIPPAPPTDPSTGQATTPSTPHTPCGTWWHWTLYDWTADHVGVTVLAEGDASGLGDGAALIGSFLTDPTHTYEICYHTVTDDCAGHLTNGPDVCEWFNLVPPAPYGYSTTTAVRATNYAFNGSDVDVTDSNPNTSFPLPLVASSNSSTTPGNRQSSSWLITGGSPSNDQQAGMAFLGGRNPGDAGYGTVVVGRQFPATPSGGPYTAWIQILAVALMDSSKTVAVVRICGSANSFNLGDGVFRPNGYYLVRYNFPGVNPDDVKQLTFTATSGPSDPVDTNPVEVALLRTGADAVSIIVLAESMKPGAWLWGGTGVTILQAPGSPGNTTYQANLLYFDYTPSAGTMNHATGYALTPSPNAVSGQGARWQLTADRDSATGQLWVALAASLQGGTALGFQRVTLDAQTYTAPYGTGWHGLAVGWDPATRQCVKILGMADSQNRLASTVALSLTRHGGVTKVLVVSQVVNGTPSTTVVAGARTAPVNDPSNVHLVAAIYLPATDTVTFLVDVAAADAALLGQSLIGVPVWTGSRWMVAWGSTAPEAVWTIDEAGLVRDTTVPSVAGAALTNIPVQTIAGGRPTTAVNGDVLWFFSRSPAGGGTFTWSRGKED